MPSSAGVSTAKQYCIAHVPGGPLNCCWSSLMSPGFYQNELFKWVPCLPWENYQTPTTSETTFYHTMPTHTVLRVTQCSISATTLAKSSSNFQCNVLHATCSTTSTLPTDRILDQWLVIDWTATKWLTRVSSTSCLVAFDCATHSETSGTLLCDIDQ